MLKKWETLPDYMQNDEVRVYYDSLQKKKVSMFLKRVMDLVGGLILLILLAIPMIVISIMIKLDSEAPYFIDRKELQLMENISRFINLEQWLVMQIRLVLL